MNDKAEETLKETGRDGPPILCYVCKKECSPVACIHCAKELQDRRTPSKDDGEEIRKIWRRLEHELHSTDGLDWIVVEAISIDLGMALDLYKPPAQEDEGEDRFQFMPQEELVSLVMATKTKVIEAENKIASLQVALAEKEKVHEFDKTELIERTKYTLELEKRIEELERDLSDAHNTIKEERKPK